ncbi:MAG: hypothetical protein IJV98_08440 [Clostridia bacterium]|nr:hypothetical protein [Clostridia bacterium]
MSTVMLFFCACAPTEYVYHNTATVTTNFFITELGLMVIDVRYMGYRDRTAGAEISLAVEERMGDGTWSALFTKSYAVEGYCYTEQYTDWVGHLGTYRLTACYLVLGRDGSTDTITATREYVLSEGVVCSAAANGVLCRYLPNADCTAPGVCERCKTVPEKMKQSAHFPSGEVVYWDETYHYCRCDHVTPFGDPCTYIGGREHSFSEQVRGCLYCGYGK